MATHPFSGVSGRSVPLAWERGRLLQRLFSTFPDGWPGVGLLLLRVGAAVPLIYFGFAGTFGGVVQPAGVLRLLAIAGGLLLLVGLWTPVAGIVVAIDALWIAISTPFAHQDAKWLQTVLAVLAVGVAMLGPGAWSIDARLFGRRRFQVNGRNRLHGPTK